MAGHVSNFDVGTPCHAMNSLLLSVVSLNYEYKMLYAEILLSTVILSGDTTIMADSKLLTIPVLLLSMYKIHVE